MPLLIDSNSNIHRPYSFKTESEFEKIVVRLADHIFGTSSIYVDVKKGMRGKGVVGIPDGYLVDMTQPTEPRLFIIENEIVSHDPFRHIGIQLLKFATSFEDARLDVRKMIMSEIQKNPTHLERLSKGALEAKSRNIDSYLDQAVFGEFRAVVIIDDARPELHNVLEKINANISVIELKALQSDKGNFIYQFGTLYDEYDEESPLIEKKAGMRQLNSNERERIIAQRALSDTVIVPAHEEGFKKVFLGQNQWYQIRIGAAMKDRIKFIAAYQVKPISAVTHLAEVKEIRPYQDSGKYVVIFKGPAEVIKPVKLKNPNYSPQGPVYTQKKYLLKAKNLEEALNRHNWDSSST